MRDLWDPDNTGVVAEGRPEDIAKVAESFTGQFLAEMLKPRLTLPRSPVRGYVQGGGELYGAVSGRTVEARGWHPGEGGGVSVASSLCSELLPWAIYTCQEMFADATLN